MSTGDSDFRGRIHGALWGALVGDALGVPVEFQHRSARDADPVVGMRAMGTHRQPAGTWSDDGALLLCQAESLLGGFSTERMGALFVRWMQSGHWTARGDVFDIGFTTQEALARVRSGIAAEKAGGTDEQENGNGSLMRIAPVGLWAFRAPASSVAEAAMAASRITHAHVRSQLACAFYCVLLTGILQGKDLRAAWSTAAAELEWRLAELPREREAFRAILDGSIAQARRENVSSGGYVIDTLEAALWCVAQHGDFSSAVLAAVNLGYDTDTTGCVAGALAGALYGEAAIPAEWLEALPRQAEVGGLIASFVTVCARTTSQKNFMSVDNVRISKFLSLVLRHEPQRADVVLDSAGWVAVDALLRGCAKAGKAISRERLETIVADCNKQRFAFSEDGQRIRANQGHSVEVELDYAPAEPPAVLYHGTAERFLDAILATGLDKRARHHVHLSADRAVAVNVGSRHGRPVVLVVDIAGMCAAGHLFYRSANGVWLTDAVPARFLRVEAA